MFPAFQPQAEGCFCGSEGEDGLGNERTPIHFQHHFVPCDSVLRLPVDEGPARSIHSSMLWEGAVVAIDGTALGEGEVLLVEEAIVEDRKKVVAWGVGERYFFKVVERINAILVLQQAMRQGLGYGTVVPVRF